MKVGEKGAHAWVCVCGGGGGGSVRRKGTLGGEPLGEWRGGARGRRGARSARGTYRGTLRRRSQSYSTGAGPDTFRAQISKKIS